MVLPKKLHIVIIFIAEFINWSLCYWSYMNLLWKQTLFKWPNFQINAHVDELGQSCEFGIARHY